MPGSQTESSRAHIYSPPVPWADDDVSDQAANSFDYSIRFIARSIPYLAPFWPDVPPMHPGQYQVLENGENILDLEIRDIEVTNLGIDPEAADFGSGSISVNGNFTVYPNLRVNNVDGWKPAAPISYQLCVGHPALDRSDWIEITESVTQIEEPDENGLVASFSRLVDLSPLEAAFNSLSLPFPDILVAEAHAIVEVEDGENTITKIAKTPISDDNREFRRKKDPCKPTRSCNTLGALKIRLNNMVMTGYNFEESPQSMGYGWQMPEFMRVEEDVHGNLTFHASGEIERWLLDGTDYIPAHKDNRIRAEKNLDDTFTLTFRDKSVMNFDLQNRVSSLVDPNGNTKNFTYETGVDGRLIQVSDQFGREKNFGYIGMSRQPSTITSHSGLKSTGGSGTRTTSYAYWPSGQLKTVTDAEGYQTNYAYVGGRLQSITDSTGVAAFYEYFPDGRLKSETQYDEQKLSYVYNDIINTIEVTERDLLSTGPDAPADRVSTHYLDRYQNIVKTVDPIGNETFYGFDDPNDPHLLTSVTNPNGSTRYRHNADGNVVGTTDALGNTTTMKYEREDLPDFVTEITRPSGGGTTKMTYDSSGNLTSVEDANGETTDMSYDSDGFLLSVTNRNGVIITTYGYGGPHKNLTSISTPKEGGGSRTVSLTYDGFDNVSESSDDLMQTVSMKYDDLDRLIEMTDARQNTVEYEFSTSTGYLSKVISPGNSATTSNRETVMTYDSTGRLEEIFRDVQGGSQSRVKYAYDGFSQLRELSRKKHSGATLAYKFAYDELGRPISLEDTLSETTSTNYAPFCTRQATTTARGIRAISVFDPLCRPIRSEVGSPALDPLELDETDEVRTMEYDNLGRLIRTTQAPTYLDGQSVYGTATYNNSTYVASGNTMSHERTYEYNILDRLEKINFEDGSSSTFEYDLEGNMTMMQDANGKITRYNYHDNNLLHEVEIERNGSVVGKFVYSYDEIGLPLTIAYPQNTGITAEFTNSNGDRGWNENGQLKLLRYMKSGEANPIRSLEFQYDDSGNRTVQSETSPTGTVYWKYSYDYLDRLSKVEKGTSETDVVEVSYYQYDESDNCVEFKLTEDMIRFLYDYNDGDQLVSMVKEETDTPTTIFTETFTSDEDGNLTSRLNDLTGLTTTYTWDKFNKLVAVSTSDSSGPTNDLSQQNSYSINGFRRKRKDKNGQVTSEYSAALSSEVEKNSADTISYISGPSLLGFENSSGLYYFLTDALGSVKDIVRGTDGVAVQSYSYNERGQQLLGSGAGSIDSRKTFVGGLSVNDDTGDSGLYLMGHRHYDPSLGRFLNRDPIGFAGGLNLYSYAGNNPVTKVDYTGLEPETRTLGVTRIGIHHQSKEGFVMQTGRLIIAGDLVLNGENSYFDVEIGGQNLAPSKSRMGVHVTVRELDGHPFHAGGQETEDCLKRRRRYSKTLGTHYFRPDFDFAKGPPMNPGATDSREQIIPLSGVSRATPTGDIEIVVTFVQQVDPFWHKVGSTTVTYTFVPEQINEYIPLPQQGLPAKTNPNR